MAKVTVHEEGAVRAAPSAAASVKAADVHRVTDVRGRSIALKRPSVLAEYRLVDGLGTSASNVAYMNMAIPLLYVVEIDGEAVVPPVSKRQIEALAERLDRDGLDALGKAMEHFAPPDEETLKASIKN